MKQAKIFNIKLMVQDLNKSIEFYKAIFSHLGFVSSCYFKDDPYDQGDTWAIWNNNTIFELQESVEKNVSCDIKKIGLYRIELYA